MRRLITRAIDRIYPRPTPASQDPFKTFDYPALDQARVENAKLFADRENLLKHFSPDLIHGAVAEVGVLLGDFSDLILRTIAPALFVAIDTFNAHERRVIKGKPSSEIFQGKTHIEYYRQRFSSYGEKLLCDQGLSWECLSKYPEGTFDLIYIDAGHDYESVKKDANEARKRIKREGLLIFNDYIKYSHYEDCYYGVIPVVNDLVVNKGFEVVGFALQCDMYCDIALRRRGRDGEAA